MNSGPINADGARSSRTSEDRRQDIEAWYATYRRGRTDERNDPVTNAEVAMQALAYDHSFLAALRATGITGRSTRMLDVGCGGGGGIGFLVRLGFDPRQLTGIDIAGVAIEQARARYPGVTFEVQDGAALPYASGSFDIVLESYVLIQVGNDDARPIAREMTRVAKPGGFLILLDWRYARPRSTRYRALTRRRIDDLFGVGRATRRIGEFPGALVPPIGRGLSKWAHWLYFPVAAALPFTVGQVATVLRVETEP